MDTPIRDRLITSMRRRPSRSPKWPKMTEPMGRIRKPTAKVEKASSVAVHGSLFGKNNWPKTSADAVP